MPETRILTVEKFGCKKEEEKKKNVSASMEGHFWVSVGSTGFHKFLVVDVFYH